ncbi:hypothetical protein SynNOUM97013_00394 [Synechococcus sp. NOUM97013]|nr:hypothetical protein SynNOUM97013_00394 [Synechococcus sp. NOUM97013]
MVLTPTKIPLWGEDFPIEPKLNLFPISTSGCFEQSMVGACRAKGLDSAAARSTETERMSRSSSMQPFAREQVKCGRMNPSKCRADGSVGQKLAL